jgi:arginase
MLVLNWHIFDPLDHGLNVTLRNDARVINAAPADPRESWRDLIPLYTPVVEMTARTEDPVVLSGDCITPLAVLAGLQRRGVDAALIWFDAHGDFHTEETTHSGYLGGLPLAKAVGRGDQTLPQGLGLRVLREDRVLLVDARDLDAPEVEALSESGVRRATVTSVRESLPEGPVHLHVDLDVFDSALVRGLRFPAPNGPGMDEVCAGIRAVVASGRLVALSIAATWRPEDTIREQTDAVLGAVLAAAQPFSG